MGRSVGLMIVVAGILVVLAGLLVWTGGLSWFGRLPGDVRIEHGNVRVYVPFVSMLLISVGVSVVLSLLGLLFRR
jgi:hypothetical protein